MNKLTRPEKKTVTDVAEEWTQTIADAVFDPVGLFDAAADLYEIHGLRPPADIIYCAHPGVPMIATTAARWMCARDRPANSTSANESSAACHQVRMVNFNLLYDFELTGTPVRLMVSKYGCRTGRSYIRTLGKYVTDELNRCPDIRQLDSLRTSIYIGRLRAGFSHYFDGAHGNALFNSVNRALRQTSRAMGFNYRPGISSLRDDFEQAQADYEYEGVVRLMANYILFSILDARNAEWETDCSHEEQADLQKIRLESRFLRRFYESGGWMFLALERTMYIVKRPKEIRVNDRNMLHSDSGPAAVLADGLELYRHHGMIVPAAAICAPHTLTVETILKERNVEIRRLMIARKGMAAFIRECCPEPIDQDVDRLGNPRKLYRIRLERDEPAVVLHVVDPAKRRLGLDADVFLRVPPGRREAERVESGWSDADTNFWERVGGEMTTCAQATAWTFGCKPEDYSPTTET